MIKKLLAVLGLAFVALLAVPSAASAYAPGGNGVGDVTGRPVPGGSLNVGFEGVFAPGEKVEIIVTCPGAADMVLDDVADADGSTSTDFTVPAGATGTCSIAARGVSSGAAGTAAFSIIPADSGTSGGDDLAVTGASTAAVVWLGAGTLIVGAVLLRVRSLRRSASN
ncbi:hypothetical protein CLV49_2540 [Labedella gwakjiensis]|uniref:LPXTG-motif cell wall-anchored protein n=1 Tax=Labedella gwakjiensis TaxID=390269 RepID=A0A2P8GY68_9MICO|nr:hypothetical protein [Labedella gwakjiensis]PSL38910.1 hypothetical protein CLV49_2540 [Labedella gwakjiensis]RUQ86626.1 hypothetical protein ELQ93_06520 [Labedella gwakjiensis]